MTNQTPDPNESPAEAEANGRPYVTEAHKARAWSAQTAANILRSRGIMSAGSVMAYEVITLADWIATGHLPDLDVDTTEETTLEDDGAQGGTLPEDLQDLKARLAPQDDTWAAPFITREPSPEDQVVTMPAHRRDRSLNELAADLGMSKGRARKVATDFLGNLGVRVEVIDL